MVRQHISSEALLAFALEREPLSRAARQHLDGCPLCQQQVSCSQKTAAYLVSRIYRSQCPSATTLSYYCLPGVLSEEEYAQVSGHVARCPLCAAEIAESRQFLELSE